MNHEFFIAGALGIGPAIFVLWHALRRYDYPYVEKALFDSRKVFFSFAVGMVFGVVSSSFGGFLPGFDVASVLSLSITLALLEESFKLVYLNLKRFQRKFDTTFYGSSLGLGMASTIALANAYIQPKGTLFTLNYLILLLIFSIGINSLHCFTGALIGFASSKGRSWFSFLKAVLSRIVFAVLILPFFLASQSEILLPLASLVACAVYSLFLYSYAYFHILPETLPESLRRERRRKARKAALKN